MTNLTYDLYIGSNNDTGELQVDLAESVLRDFFDGYTLTYATGVWRGQREKSLVVTICDTADGAESRRVRVMDALCVTLGQDAVAYRDTAPMYFHAPQLV